MAQVLLQIICYKIHCRLTNAISFTAGVLTILLQVPPNLLAPYIKPILSSVDALCSLALARGGHLPSSLPEHSRGYNLVQICHGAPGLLPLLAAARSLPPQLTAASHSSGDETPKVLWEQAMEAAVNAIWTEGLAKKGLGVCHGVSGNGWVLLTMAASVR